MKALLFTSLKLTFLAMLLILAKDVVANLAVSDVPTFKCRARVISCEGKQPDGKTFDCYFYDAYERVTGDAWTNWFTFGPKQIETALQMVPNYNSGRYPVVINSMTINGVDDPTGIEMEVLLTEDEPVTKFSFELCGPNVALLVWRDDEAKPHLSTMAEYNQRYWEAFKTVNIPETERPKLFPVIDRFIGGSDDLKEWDDGIKNLARAGFNSLSDIHGQRDILLKSGLHSTSGGVYSPPGYCFDFTPTHFDWSKPDPPGTTTLEGLDRWAKSLAEPYLKIGFKREDISSMAMSDEPGWYYPMMFKPLTENPAALQRFRDYIKSQGLTPADVGAASWDKVLPLGRGKAVDLASRRLFYWTMRFFSWDSSRHFANATCALEKAFYPNIPVHTNLNFFNGRLYTPGPCGWNPDKTNPDAAMGGHDWLEFGRMRACTMLWTEDWFSDAQAYQWSFYCAKLRCAAEKGGVNFGGYVIPRMAGDRQDGLLQKVITIIGNGGKGLHYFVFGPEYNFVTNCYSENLKVLPKIAEAHQMIGKAEDVLWPGKRPRTPVAILAPRSAEMWDQKNIPIPNDILDATNTNLNSATVDYMAEVFDLYVALQHANIPVDFVEEDDLNLKGLKNYKVLYVTEPNIPAEFQKGLVRWVKKGGTLVSVTGAGAADRYDDPCNILARGIGIVELPRERMIIGSLDTLTEAGKGTGAFGGFTVFGPRGKLADLPTNAVLASFSDGSPAVLERQVGSGRVIHFPWMPGLSYMKSSTTTKDRLPVGFSETIREMIAYPVQSANITPPVTIDKPMIETPLLLSAKGGAVTLLNWSGEAEKYVTIKVRVPFRVRSVESIKRGKLAFSQTKEGLTCSLPLNAADIVLLRH